MHTHTVLKGIAPVGHNPQALTHLRWLVAVLQMHTTYSVVKQVLQAGQDVEGQSVLQTTLHSTCSLSPQLRGPSHTFVGW